MPVMWDPYCKVTKLYMEGVQYNFSEEPAYQAKNEIRTLCNDPV